MHCLCVAEFLCQRFEQGLSLTSILMERCQMMKPRYCGFHSLMSAVLNLLRLMDHLVNFVSVRRPPRPLRAKAGLGTKEFSIYPGKISERTFFSELHKKCGFLVTDGNGKLGWLKKTFL